jgi:hypothetical protein
MKQRGLSLELISQESEVELEVLKQFLPQVIKKTVETHAAADKGKGPHEISLDERVNTLGSPDHCKTYSRSPPATTEETKQPSQSTKTLPKPQHSHIPTFFYCCKRWSNKLRRVNLLTGEQAYHKVPSYRFLKACRWSELPGGSLLITGGIGPVREPVRDVVKIDTLREYAASSQPPMHTAKSNHTAVYHSQYVYVLGYTECERYSSAESRWEVLPAPPVAGAGMSAVELHNSLYALGGSGVGWDGYLDTVQKLSLDSLTWQLMQLKLPQAAWCFPCFKTDTQVILVINKTLYLFTPIQVKAVMTLPENILWCYSSYYSRGTLYFETNVSIENLALGI